MPSLSWGECACAERHVLHALVAVHGDGARLIVDGYFVDFEETELCGSGEETTEDFGNCAVSLVGNTNGGCAPRR